MVGEKISRIINDFAVQLKKNHIEYESLVLFGSYAKGNYPKDSDMDIAVISSQFGKKQAFRAD